MAGFLKLLVVFSLDFYWIVDFGSEHLSRNGRKVGLNHTHFGEGGQGV